ncbi:hypothetical protein LOTGIDRAFT_160110 [Lottia gigantea]|uniref:Conserved oligomeric Golgi complex subunit 3 C-terminal domain-containing protein n=1 Tax=Lottia gigantea TaxID=225164 RepID=V3ZX67_LOTGI|nr:hypothetical protein LOTGIDRAFT_160110 [Lottia gigantea]ESO96123.1 hypothetical protein LOTGIDRAFT_160110 [Lottia gigantea]
MIIDYYTTKIPGLEVTPTNMPMSPADLHGMWYPTVRRTLVTLSKLYRCIDYELIPGTEQENDRFRFRSVHVLSQSIAVQLTKPIDISEVSMAQAFKCLYFLTKNNFAHTTNFPKLLNLEKHLRVDITSKINAGEMMMSVQVTQYIEDNNLPYSTLRGIGTDGAAVMTGKRNGAVKQIIERQKDKWT